MHASPADELFKASSKQTFSVWPPSSSVSNQKRKAKLKTEEGHSADIQGFPKKTPVSQKEGKIM